MNETIKVLYAEDDIQSVNCYLQVLEKVGCSIDVAMNGIEALNKYNTNVYDMIILDMDLPLKNGHDIIRIIRHKGDNIPIIILSSSNHSEALYEGADDYIEKGDAPKNIRARLDKAFERVHQMNRGKDSNIFQLNRQTNYNRISRVLTINGKRYKLSSIEGKLFWQLCIRINELVPTEVLCDNIWNVYNKTKIEALTRYISLLRKFLKNDPSIVIENEFLVGYKLIANE